MQIDYYYHVIVACIKKKECIVTCSKKFYVNDNLFKTNNTCYNDYCIIAEILANNCNLLCLYKSFFELIFPQKCNVYSIALPIYAFSFISLLVKFVLLFLQGCTVSKVENNTTTRQ